MFLSAKDIRVSYSGRLALEGVSLSIGAGEIVALLGPNGSGKSTFLGTLSGLVHFEEGNVIVDGTDQRVLSRLELSRRIAVVPQGVHFAMPFTVAETVFMGRFPHLGRFGRHGRQDYDVVRDSLERVGLTGFDERRVTALSGGEAQRVSIARALAQETPALLLDEPTSALDPGHTLDVVSLLRGLRDEGRAIGIAVHDVNMALSMADRLVFLKNGCLIHGCSPEDVTPDLLEKVYNVAWKVETLDDGRVVAFPWNKVKPAKA